MNVGDRVRIRGNRGWIEGLKSWWSQKDGRTKNNRRVGVYWYRYRIQSMRSLSLSAL